MIRLEPKNKKELLRVSLGLMDAECVITNGNLVNVISGEIYPADVYIHDGFIAHIETKELGINLKAKRVIDAQGQFMIPGLIDSHVHIESSMLTPRNFARGVIIHGTTTVITDPHEIANVYGTEAVRYMHAAGDDLPMRQLIDIPSCVPSVPGKENCGADFTYNQIKELTDLPRVIGLAEVMDYLAVIHGEERMMNILDTAKRAGLYLQGHAPFLSGRSLSAYLIGGPKTCHESRTSWEFKEKVRNGMFVDARESSITKNIAAAVEGTKSFRFFDHVCLCTDDKEPDDIINEGHMNEVVRKAIEYGFDPMTAIRCATYHSAREVNLEHLGAIAPGYVADILLVSSLSELKPSMVMFEGKIVAENGHLIKEINDLSFEIETRNSMNVAAFSPDLFVFKAPILNGTVKVTVMTYDDYDLSNTKAVVEDIKVKDGVLDLSSDPDLKFVTVMNRYGNGTIGYGVVRKFGTTHGAVASTVSHDCHNLTVVYDTPENAYAAAKTLVDCGGGMCVAAQGKVVETLVLRVGGLMSNHNVYEVAKEAGQMKVAMRSVGLIHMKNPLLRIVTLALPVIPHCKMSDLGIINVDTKEIMPLYPEFQ